MVKSMADMSTSTTPAAPLPSPQHIELATLASDEDSTASHQRADNGLAGGFHSRWWDPQTRWMVYFMENLKITWRKTGGTMDWKPPWMILEDDS